MNFYALANAWWFALLVPLVVFYFLKLRRPRQEVTSLALWRQVLSDQRVNSPFQKFKRNILLLLQVALLSLLVLAVMQPVLTGGAERVNRLPILIDTSASMAALDGRGGTARLDEARARVRELIEDLPSGQEVSLIAFNSTARRLTEFTDNKRILREALSQLEVSDVPGDVTEALRMTEGLARTVSADTPIDKVLLVSDGNLPGDIEFALPFDIEFHKLAAGGTNFGVTALGAARVGTRDWEVFVRIEGTRAAEGGVTVSISQGGEAAGEERVFLGPGESRRVAFRLDGSTATSVEVRINPDAFDSLAADNTAWLSLPAARPLTVYVPADLSAYRHALEALEGVTLYPSADGGESSLALRVGVADTNPKRQR
ncbi:MAG: BatA and WFA domain-containing protein, partial [Planctomycetes bacterium]|nr:BatA and WFA domain-containing protein [Planctomycetota bacterium]